MTIKQRINKIFAKSTSEYKDKPVSEIYDLKYGDEQSSKERTRERTKTDSIDILIDILSQFNPKYQDLKVLNVGGNDGQDIKPLELQDLHIIDISKTSLQRGKKLSPNHHFYFQSAEKIEFPKSFFDIYISLKTFQSSLFDIKQGFREAIRVTKPKGLFIISIPTGYLTKNGDIVSGLMDKGILVENKPEKLSKKIESGLSESNLNFETKTGQIEKFFYGQF